ncbi:hypothetical protein Pint_20680 [Pistacia integerrima]|uniref:Uncharacterized protein n=1 Tax=Pistacia integerrima TaxID=434235 RepID=A0ACC0XF30_9ROSI|nr:hypothetical protein Pint_20680 [Pistacia integerrima]
MADSESRRRGSSKRSSSVTLPGTVSSPSLSSSSSPPPVPSAPCGACKFLRRKCVSGCIFAPYFGTDQGAARFAAVHKVFGASNVSKLLLHIPVGSLQAELAMVQGQLLNSRFTMANALQNSPPPPPPAAAAAAAAACGGDAARHTQTAPQSLRTSSI